MTTIGLGALATTVGGNAPDSACCAGNLSLAYGDFGAGAVPAALADPHTRPAPEEHELSEDLDLGLSNDMDRDYLLDGFNEPRGTDQAPGAGQGAGRDPRRLPAVDHGALMMNLLSGTEGASLDATLVAGAPAGVPTIIQTTRTAAQPNTRWADNDTPPSQHGEDILDAELSMDGDQHTESCAEGRETIVMHAVPSRHTPKFIKATLKKKKAGKAVSPSVHKVCLQNAGLRVRRVPLD